MKSPLEKLRKIAINKSEPKENWDHRISVHVEGLAQAAKDMKEMRTCYDSLLSAAAATANSAYEFSESLLEMGNCLLEKTSMYNDGESAEPLSMLGKVQLELQKLVDCYRSHVIMTITNPSESLLSELRKVEEMKLQCDEKREMFEYMVGQVREKGKSRHGKGDTFTSQQLQAVCDEYDDAARLCVFRVESLKQGQSRSLLTQAVRHHAAQLNFFKKGLQSLESVEPRIKNVAEMQHIDYEICDLNEEDVEGNSFETRGDDELSFDYRRNQQMDDDVCVSRNSSELDQLGALGSKSFKSKDSDVLSNTGKNQGEQILSQPRRVGSHSAPIFPEKSDPADRIRELRTSVQKLNTHVLPTPADARTSIAVSSITSVPNPLQPTRSSKNLWHSSPLNVEKPKNEHLSAARGVGKSHMEAEDSSSNKQPLPLPLPLASVAPLQQFDTSHNAVDTQKNIRQAFSGPLASKSSSSSKPLLSGVNGPISSIDLQSRASGAQLPTSVNSGLPTLTSTPKISELHELPRPPDALSSKPRRSLGALGHSAPLGNRNHREVTNSLRQSREGSPLPLPQLTVSRSFSIPSSSERALDLQSRKLLESSQVMEKVEELASPPLTPMSLSNIKSSPKAGQIRGKVNPVIVAVRSSA